MPVQVFRLTHVTATVRPRAGRPCGPQSWWRARRGRRPTGEPSETTTPRARTVVRMALEGNAVRHDANRGLGCPPRARCAPHRGAPFAPRGMQGERTTSCLLGDWVPARHYPLCWPACIGGLDGRFVLGEQRATSSGLVASDDQRCLQIRGARSGSHAFGNVHARKLRRRGLGALTMRVGGRVGKAQKAHLHLNVPTK